MRDCSLEKMIEELSNSKNRISRAEIRKYYQQQNIDFPRNKDGNPNMSYSQNKKTYQELFKRKFNHFFDEFDKSSLLKRAKKSSSVSELTHNNSENDDFQECIICFEPLKKDLVILECKHMYCVDCSLRHFKNKTNCPLCQKEIISKKYLNNLEYGNVEDTENIIHEHEINHIINQEIRNTLHERNNQPVLSRISAFFK